jgi:hypothetical protein
MKEEGSCLICLFLLLFLPSSPLSFFFSELVLARQSCKRLQRSLEELEHKRL